MLISSNFASQTRWSIFALDLQMHQAAPAINDLKFGNVTEPNHMLKQKNGPLWS